MCDHANFQCSAFRITIKKMNNEQCVAASHVTILRYKYIYFHFILILVSKKEKYSTDIIFIFIGYALRMGSHVPKINKLGQRYMDAFEK